ncbi:carbonic anhydrase [Varunaivibrio sulfuroxidans]|uniref:Carbonic anhydrase n=1 Tax=Varunaivibrio sulfuroxidans TaxID=1773489 RepID=A0A4R3JAC6_9PROT|nr:carbonic anhydrase family protein [Varunaivibrio sulfuroxidans]TCS62494.1 carbonic anhydrase [Varunaivibrio sulfuroxidans]WES30834.1 carbonic anhydrase family protein [Varunaivibrio sulfuroxidans]
MIERRTVLKFIAGAVAGGCPTCLSIANAFASETAAAKGAQDARRKIVSNPHWGYEGADGPEAWGELSPAYAVCSKGMQQSPIDLAGALEAQTGNIPVNYGALPLKVINNGHTIQVNCDPGNSIMLDGAKFKLLQYHFHHPSEHALNGDRFEMEAHFVHADENGRLAVLGTFFRPGPENPALAKIWDVMPREAGGAKTGGMLSPLALLPQNRTYYRYLGSLTTPPCSETVIWTVFASPLQMSQAQVKTFAEMFPMNARPLQNLLRRYLLKSY